MNALITVAIAVATAAFAYAASGTAAIAVVGHDIALVPAGLALVVGVKLVERLSAA